MGDPRTGSSRDNSTSPGISRVISGANSSSLSTLLGTLIPVLVYVSICIIILLVFRTRWQRVYSPRTFLSSLYDHERPPKLPAGTFKWIKPFWRTPDTVVLDHSSLDAYLFLRFLKILTVISFVGCCLTWPVLLPLHATGGGGNTQLDMLTFGNIVDPHRYYAHAILAWIYFGFVLYMVIRESIYSINIRQAYLMSPFLEYLNESRLRATFGDAVKRIWLPRYIDDLENLVKERNQTAFRLERAEIALIKFADAARAKAVKVGIQPMIETSDEVAEQRRQSAIRFFQPKEAEETWESQSPSPVEELTLPDVSGSVASQWIPHSARPVHRPIGNLAKKVDTINWCRSRLKTLNWQIKRERRKALTRYTNLLPSVFVEFNTQREAQIACQTLSHHQPLRMSNRYIGVRPYEIIWGSLSLAWWSRIVRKFTMQSFIVVLIIFWALPCALVGIISNIHAIAGKVVFLHWILKLPKPILGLITGLVPAVALSLLMDTVPWIVRTCAGIAGTPSLSQVELYTQNNYFAFQIIQVFLVTTLTSAISSCLAQILSNPPSALNLLSQNLPKSSNFYISYALVQCLGRGAGQLLPFFSFFFHVVLQKFGQDTRKKYVRWHRLRLAHWGTLFPVFTNLGVIAMSYSLIAPLVLGFTTVGLFFVYHVYRYTLLYMYDSEIDTRGQVYPNALSHLLVGLYFAEICMIGLFALQYAAVPIALMIALLLFTALIHMSLLDAIGPLLVNLPVTTNPDREPIDNNIPIDADVPFNDETDAEWGPDWDGIGAAAEEDTAPEPGDTRGEITLEGLPAGLKGIQTGLRSLVKSRLKSEGLSEPPDPNKKPNFLHAIFSPLPHHQPNLLTKWLHPSVFASPSVLREAIPPASALPTPLYPREVEPYLYQPPAMYAAAPRLFVPRDVGGVSRQEIRHSSKVIPITDEDWEMDEEKKELRMDFSSTKYLPREGKGRW